jgi:membrane-associated phospholipid phosphatase
LITAALFQVFIKWLIGGLRPHFYAVCQPSVEASGFGFASLMHDRSVCTGNENDIDDALQSMPSGHATAAWAGLFFLALYFNAQLKVMSAHNPAYWKMIMFFAPLLGAFLISASLTIDRYHNWYDVVVGGLIGTAAAIVAFRQTFASVTDFRFNHVLLPRATSLFHRRAFLPSGREPYYTYSPVPQFFSHDLPFTREGGWGHGQGEQFTGAPYDATVLTSGVGAVGNIANRNSTSTYGTYGGHGMGGGAMAQKVDEGGAGISGPGRFAGTNTAGNTTGNNLGNNMAGSNLTGTDHHLGANTGLGTTNAGTRDPAHIV